jgi:nucleoside-diphosphate-sugar epimerase
LILVTGATGFVGRHVTAALVKNGRRVRILTRGKRADAALPPDVEVTRGDLRDPASLPAAVANVETVVHLAAAVGAYDQVLLDAINVVGSAALAAAARAAGVQRFVHCSSGGVYGDGDTPQPHSESDVPAPGAPYEHSKLRGESAVRAAFDGSSTSWVILRPQGVYGPGRPQTAELIRQVAHRKFWLHGPAAIVIHPTYIDDVVNAALLAIDCPGAARATLNIAGERPMTYRALIDEIANRLGVRARHLSLPSAPTRAVAHPLARLARSAHLPVYLRLDRLSRRIINRAVDTNLAREKLGFIPVPFANALDATIEWARLARIV